MAGPDTHAPVLVPLSVVHQGQRVDLAMPGTVAVAELLVAMVQALGRLTPGSATQGFRVLTASGRELDQSRTLAEQHVGAGALLTLQAAGSGVGDARYDDLVEAVGTAVSAQRSPWGRDDSILLSACAATGLFVLAALALAIFGTDRVPTVAVGVTGAALATLAAALLARRDGGAAAATPVALSAALLTGAAASALADGSAAGLRALLAGAGVVVGGLATLVLPARQRASFAGPLVAGLGLMMLGGLTWGLHVEQQRAAATVLAASAVLTLLVPWIGLAQVPARIDGLSPTSLAPVSGRDVERQLRHADVTVLSLRIAAGLLAVLLAPLVAVTGLGALLVAAVAVAGMLGTRSLRGRAEVVVGVLAGLLTAIVGAATVVVRLPETLAWVAAAALTLAVFVLSLNVVGPRARPALARAADTLQVVALMAVLPVTALLWGAL